LRLFSSLRPLSLLCCLLTCRSCLRASDEAPFIALPRSSSLCVPSLTASPVACNGDTPTKRGLIVGDQALGLRRDGMEMSPAFDQDGLIANWDAYESILSHAYSVGVQASSEDYGVMYAEPTHACVRQRERIGELLFEKHAVPALAVSPAVVLAAYANGRHTGVVLDVGDATTTAAPVLDGTVARSLVLRTRVAGRSLSEAVATQVAAEGKVPLRPLWAYRRLTGEAASAAAAKQRAAAEAEAKAEAAALTAAADEAAAKAAAAAAAAEAAAEHGDEITPVNGGANDGPAGDAASAAAAAAAASATAATTAAAAAAAARRLPTAPATLARRLARLPPPVEELHLPGTTRTYAAFARLRLVESIKEALCRVEEPLSAAAAAAAASAAAAGAMDGDGDEDASDVQFTLPDGNVVDLGGARQFAAAGALFGRLPHAAPPRAALASAGGISFAAPAAAAAHAAAYGAAGTTASAGLSGLVLDALRSAEPGTHKDLWAGICLTGGTSNLGGLFERLSGELMGHHFRARVLAASGVPERRFCTWTGGSILATFTDFQKMWVSKADYEEVRTGARGALWRARVWAGAGGVGTVWARRGRLRAFPAVGRSARAYGRGRGSGGCCGRWCSRPRPWDR